MNGSLHRRYVVSKYGDTIHEYVSRAKKWIVTCDRDVSDEEILTFIEDMIFDSDRIERIEISAVREVIQSIYCRIRYKYGILQVLLDDEKINEIMVNGPDRIFVEKNRRIIEIDDAFVSEDELEEEIRMLASDVHREINEAHPIVDARLPNGFRVSGVLKNVALNGPILTIRKFANDTITLQDLIDYGSIDGRCAEELATYVKCGYNIFISGGTSSGKTTFLNALAEAIDPDERVIIIEDSAELKIESIANNVHLECRNANSIGQGEVTMAELIRTSLRMRPDRIIVGEVRGKEVVDMIQAMNTGHSGSMSTGHGNSIRGMLNRLETMYMMDAQIPIYSVKSQIANAIDIFVHLKRDSKGKRKVMEIAELVGFDGTDYQLNYLYKLNPDGILKSTGNKLIDDERLRAQYA